MSGGDVLSKSENAPLSWRMGVELICVKSGIMVLFYYQKEQDTLEIVTV